MIKRKKNFYISGIDFLRKQKISLHRKQFYLDSGEMKKKPQSLESKLQKLRVCSNIYLGYFVYQKTLIAI